MRIGARSTQQDIVSLIDSSKSAKTVQASKRTPMGADKAGLARTLDARRAADSIDLTGGKSADAVAGSSSRKPEPFAVDLGPTAVGPSRGVPSGGRTTDPGVDPAERASRKAAASGVGTSREMIDGLRRQNEQLRGDRRSWAMDEEGSDSSGATEETSSLDRLWEWTKGMFTSGSAGTANPVAPPGAGEVVTLLNGPKVVEDVTGDSRDLLNGFLAVFQSGDKNPRLKEALDEEQKPLPDGVGEPRGNVSEAEIEEKIRERREGLMQPSGDGFETRPEIDPNALRGPGAIFSNPRTANAINPGSGDDGGSEGTGAGELPEVIGVDDPVDDMVGGVHGSGAPGGDEPGAPPLTR